MQFKIIFLLLLLVFTWAAFPADSLKICAIRVEFAEDQNSLTTGNGKFVLDNTDITPFTVDPPPHNRSYFNDQIIAVRNYFLKASNRNFYVDGTVFPKGQNNAYKLPKKMSFYSPNSLDETINDARLAQLFIDAVSAADSDPDINFSEFDLVTIFHAGVGRDVDVGYDETPQDVPSLFLTSEFLTNALGGSFNGIAVDGGAKLIDSAILLPETESQADYQLGMTGIFAANIGSYLKFYDLFSAAEQASGVGRFGLMDAGQFNVYGLIPSLPTAYSRILAGWDDPVTAVPGTNIPVSRFTGENTSNPTIYRIDLNSDEYYLVEYRGDRSINIDSALIELAEGRDEFPTYLEVLQTYIPDQFQVSDSTGVLLAVDDYDWGLSGSGILIWHIDEKVIDAHSDDRLINDDPNLRGVDLEEADGSQDLGQSYSITQAGYQSELGTWLDFWFSANPSPLFQNSFDAESSPNTKSNYSYTDSHISISNFEKISMNEMRFSFSRQFGETGYPVRFGNGIPGGEFSDLKLAELSDGTKLIFTSDETGNIYFAGAAENGFTMQSDSLFAKFPINEKTVLAFSNNPQDVLVAAGRSGQVAVYRFLNSAGQISAQPVSAFNVGAEIVSGPVMQGNDIYLGLNGGLAHRYDINGILMKIHQAESTKNGFIVLAADSLATAGNNALSPVWIDFNSDNQKELVVYPDSVSFAYNGQVYQLNTAISQQPSFGDLDRDGFYEMVYNSGREIAGINFNGSAAINLPVSPILTENEFLTGTPLIVDLNSDRFAEIITATNQGRVLVIPVAGDDNGLQAFPFSTGGKINGAPLICDLDTDGSLEIFAINDQGILNGWQWTESFQQDDLWWYQQTYNSQNNLVIGNSLAPVITAEAGLMPADRVFNYPNPNKAGHTFIRYYLSEDANVNIRIFDLAGDLVTSFRGPGNGLVDNEVRWDVSDIESGMYLCRVEAKTQSRSAFKIIKIMVVH